MNGEGRSEGSHAEQACSDRPVVQTEPLPSTPPRPPPLSLLLPALKDTLYLFIQLVLSRGATLGQI